MELQKPSKFRKNIVKIETLITFCFTMIYKKKMLTMKIAPPPQNSELSHFSNLKLKSEEHKKISLLFIRLYTQTRATMTEVRMKILFRMHIYPNQISAIKQSEVKQIFLNAKPRKLEFGGSERPFLDFIYLFIAPPFCNLYGC